MIMQDTAARRVDAETDFSSVEGPSSIEALLDTSAPKASRPKARPIHKIKSLHTRKDIDAILHRECARCERNGHDFSLVVIAAGESGARRHLHRLAGLLCRRSRATDEIGWFDKSRLCVVLPDTASEGAAFFVQQFSEAAYCKGLSPLCNVLTYSGKGSDQGGDGNSGIGGFPRGVVEAGRDIDPSEGKAKSHGIKSELDKSAGRVDRSTFNVDLPMKLSDNNDFGSLLVRPLPVWKRGIDLVAGAVMLLAASPFMAGAAIAIKLSDPGPVFFRQTRAGLGGKPFTIYKFRTMVVDAEEKKSDLRAQSEQDGPAFKMKHDPRITRIGRMLRETSLDELPQLLNVVKGDMSMVGPRPLPVEESDRCDTWHRRRLDVTPGLTCIWQVYGRSVVSFAEWIRMDRSYIRGRSFWQDMKLMLMTVPSVLMRRGAR